MTADLDLRQQLAQLEPHRSQPEEEQTWNILVQVLLPLVFVLTFVLITGITAYKTAYESLQKFLDKDEDYAALQVQEKIVQLQLERLLRALEQVKAQTREDLKIVLFPTPERVGRYGFELHDNDFLHLCRATQALLNDVTAPAFFDYAGQIYRRVLEVAAVHDPRSSGVKRWNEAELKDSEMLGRAEVVLASENTILPANRRRIHNLILDFLSGLQEQTVGLQVGLARHLFDDLLTEDVAELDPTSAEILKYIIDPATPEEKRRAAAETLYRHLLESWRGRLANAGCSFLDGTWQSLEG